MSEAKRNRLSFGSLFTGVGGFDLGFENAGMKCLWQCEIDAHARSVLRHHYPNIKRFNDVREITRADAAVPSVICGGFPCQDVSVAGKRAGLAGERSGLFFEFERIVGEFEPELFVIENVPGLLSSNEKQDFATILRRMGERGYLQAWRIFDSQYFGVAQRRRRVFIVGSLGTGRCAEILFERESLSRDPAEGREAGERVAPTISARTKGGGGLGTDAEIDGGLVEHHPLAGDGSSKWAKGTGGPAGYEDYNLVTARALTARQDGSPCIDRGPEIICTARESGQGYWMDDDVSGSLRCEGENRPSRPSNVIAVHSRQDPCSSDIAFALDVSQPPANAIAFTERSRDGGRNFETQDELAYALTNPGSGGQPHSRRIVFGMSVRRLTPRECERLQGFPDDWTRHGIDANGQPVKLSDTQRYKQMGNAVTVSVAEWFGKRILRATQ